MLDREKIKRLREERGLSLRVFAAQVSDRSGKTMSYEAVRQLETGHFTPSLEKIAAIAGVLDVGINDIIIEEKAQVA